MNQPLTPPGSFRPDDVTLLLKDVTGLVAERDVTVREREIQAGRHYSEDLPIEQPPSDTYAAIFQDLLATRLRTVALYVGILTRLLSAIHPRPVLVSLVRAGTPTGVLMRRYARQELDLDLPHYGVSIILRRGLDWNALDWILDRHPAESLVFVDGWTGKGMITRELEDACARYNAARGTQLTPTLAVLADPAHATDLYASRDDFLNPSCCLNSTVCGLISRTVCNREILSSEDFHGVRVYREFASIDQTARYLDGVCRYFPELRTEIEEAVPPLLTADRTPDWQGMEAVRRIGEVFGVSDINRIKPSIGETTRVLLRRTPDRILVRETDHPDLTHIRELAREKAVPVTCYPEMPYLCCGLIADQRGARV